ncbi:MAG: class I SAM-dependent methyltransferase, partial [Nitrosotalea sp.]
MQAISKEHLDEVTRVIKKYGPNPSKLGRKLRVLEVAAYAHTTGYQLAKKFNAEVILTDISIDTLAFGKKVAVEDKIDDMSVSRIAADFHDLPFETGSYDLVYIASALHHTWKWQQVLGELTRVTASAGLLFIENEPCARMFCFYKFRSNRSDQYCELEKYLADVGLLRTVSEPYLGSRPEELFGMVENQTIPLDEIIHIISSNGVIKELIVSPDICIGKLENRLIHERHKGREHVRNMILTELTDAVEKAQVFLGKNEIMMGYALPDIGEITKLSEKVSDSITALELDEKSELYKLGLAKLFGASVRIVMKKHGQLNPVRTHLKYNWGVSKNVIIGYPQNVQSILNDTVDLLPDIQRTSIDVLEKSFPRSEWTIVQDDAG